MLHIKRAEITFSIVSRKEIFNNGEVEECYPCMAQKTPKLLRTKCQIPDVNGILTMNEKMVNSFLILLIKATPVK
jgi:hypothetical protein